MELFTMNPETKLPTIHPAALTIKCFKELWTRKRPIDGDHDGRKKLFNEKELGYVYFTGKYDSRFKLHTPEARDAKIKVLVDLPNAWKADVLVKECIGVWEDAQVTASMEYVLSLEGTVSALAKYMTTAKATIATGNLQSVDPGTIKEIIQIIKDSGNLIADVAKAKQILQKEQDALATGKKGRSFNKFEMPTGI